MTSPIVVGACSISSRVDAIKHLEDSGAGAVVIKSLFEEQVQLERKEFDEEMTQYDNAFQEAITMFPRLSHAGAKEHVYWVQKTRKETKLPLIASLNCVNPQTWVEYAVQLAETGVNALELNFYSTPLFLDVSGDEIEKREVDVVAKVRAAVKIPISVKLHSFYTNVLHVTTQMQKAGANGFVLFNRLFYPDFDLNRVEKRGIVHLSNPNDSLPSLRWTALLHERLSANIAASGGVDSGLDAVRMLLAGAQAVQVVSTLYRNGPTHITRLNDDILRWMREHNFQSVDDFRGILGKRRSDDIWTFERGQYIKAVLGFD